MQITDHYVHIKKWFNYLRIYLFPLNILSSKQSYFYVHFFLKYYIIYYVNNVVRMETGSKNHTTNILSSAVQLTTSSYA